MDTKRITPALSPPVYPMGAETGYQSSVPFKRWKPWAASLAALVVCTAAEAQTGPLRTAVLQQVARGLDNPTSIAAPADGSGRLFVA